MNKMLIPFICGFIVACGNTNHSAAPVLTDRQKLDSIQVGMPLEEVMLIYGLQDTIGRSSKAGEYGYELDTVTLENKPGSEPISPLLSIQMTDSTWLLFAKGQLMMKPEHTWEEQKKDTALMRILHSAPPEMLK